MTTYSIRCRNSQCRHRRVSRTDPDQYVRPPRCAVCGSTKGWRIEQRAYNKRGLCKCDGPMGRNNEPFPHRATHPSCEQHPHGIYNQARARGVAHEDILKEHRMLVKTDAGTYAEDQWVLSSLLANCLCDMTTSSKVDFVAGLVELLVEKGVLSPQEVGNLVYKDIEAAE